MKFWKTKVKDLEGLEKYYKNDDILVIIEGNKFSFTNIFFETTKIAVNKPYGVIEFSITPIANGTFRIFGKYRTNDYLRIVNPESYELKDIENNIRKAILEIITEIETEQKYVIIKNDIFKRIEKELNNEDFTEQEVR